MNKREAEWKSNPFFFLSFLLLFSIDLSVPEAGASFTLDKVTSSDIGRHEKERNTKNVSSYMSRSAFIQFRKSEVLLFETVEGKIYPH